MEMAPTFKHEKTNMVIRSRPCLTIYHYRIDPEFGWMHARIQTWFPFCIHVASMAGMVEPPHGPGRPALLPPGQLFPLGRGCSPSQQLFQEQLAVNWTERLQPFAQRLNPLHEEIFRNYPAQYYWTGFQCEWATDVMFRPGTLTRLAPLLLEHGMLSFFQSGCTEVSGPPHQRFRTDSWQLRGELTTDFKSRASGDRVKYRIDGNS